MELSEADWTQASILFSRLTFYCSFIPLAIGLLRRQFFSKEIKIFYLYLLIDLLIAALIQFFLWSIEIFPDFILPILERLGIGDTNFFGILYNINVVGVLGWYFSKVIPNPKISFHINWVSKALVVTMIINYLFIEGFRGLGTFNPTVAATCGFIFPSIHLWYLFRQDYQLVLARNPYFWIALGLVFSMLLGFFKALTGDQIFDINYILFTKFNITNNILIIISYSFFCIAFLKTYNLEFLRETHS